MSYSSEFAEENAWMAEELADAIEQDIQKGIWVTKDGKELKISEMETSHIKNCIRFIHKKDDDFFLGYIPVFRSELERRGEQ